MPLHGAARRESIQLAIAEHDNGWREPDAAPSVDVATGRVHDFITVPADVRQSVWPRGIARLAAQDQWAAALVAQHAITVYDRNRPDPAWAEFFNELEATRDRLRAKTALTSAELMHDYAFVRIGDLISLVFCNRWSDEQRYEQWLFHLHDASVLISPDPFEGHEIPMEISAREIADVRYESDGALIDALRVARTVTLTGVARGAIIDA